MRLRRFTVDGKLFQAARRETSPEVKSLMLSAAKTIRAHRLAARLMHLRRPDCPRMRMSSSLLVWWVTTPSRPRMSASWSGCMGYKIPEANLGGNGRRW
jgi:hypothetical protein